MLNQVADGVWVRQSEWVWSNAIVVRGEGGLILVDPGIDGSHLNRLADDADRLGIPVVAGFSTHPHPTSAGASRSVSSRSVLSPGPRARVRWCHRGRRPKGSAAWTWVASRGSSGCRVPRLRIHLQWLHTSAIGRGGFLPGTVSVG
jgi:glyoxylase-like metal-dependent hydrolase (beta-lactamase superfamily II)